MDPTTARTHRTTNTLHTFVLLLGMGLLLLLLGYALAGSTGAWFAAGFGLLTLVLSPRIAPSVIMRLYRARPLAAGELPEVQQLLAALSERAGLVTVPRPYYLPTQVMNAFTVGQRGNSAIGLTDGLLRALTFRELTGVLAHEVSHLKNNDLRVMTLADMVSRMTTTLSHFGQILLIINLPLFFMGGATVPWLAVLLLLLAPAASMLLQLALSRRRELDADLTAYELTGDARGLASALAKMERYQQTLFDLIAMPGRKIPDPSILRTHPNADERIERLLALEERPGMPPPAGASFAVPPEIRNVESRPRWHAMGVWY